MNDNVAADTALRPSIPAGTAPPLPGGGPHDGMRPPPWWKFDQDFLGWIEASMLTRGLAEKMPFSDRDFATLKAMLISVRAARARWIGDDRGQSGLARLELIQLTGYLSGFMDSKKIPGIGTGALVTGLLTSGTGSLDEQLDELEQTLDRIVQPTRGVVAATLVLGAGVGIFAAGVYHKLKALAEPDTVPD